jgi:4-hydroxy-2-oxoheptanedioate aldolase
LSLTTLPYPSPARHAQLLSDSTENANMSDDSRRRLRSRVRAGERLFGCFAFLSNATVVEVLGRAGLDFLIIDLEHGGKSWESVENMVRAAELTGMHALVRVPAIDAIWITHALETGAEGIVIPFVEDAGQVRKAAASLRYAPTGTRGTCTQTRPAGFGADRAAFVERSRRMDEEVVLVGLIESRAGAEAVAAMLREEPGLDVVMIGRSDLASDLGRPGQGSDSEVEALTSRVVDDVCSMPPTRAGVAVYSGDDAARWVNRGCTFFAYPSEVGLLFAAATALREDLASACDRATERTVAAR